MVTTPSGSSKNCSRAYRSRNEMKPRFGILLGLYGCVLGAITLGWLFGLPELTALSVAAGALGLLCLFHLLLGPPLPRVDADVTPRAVQRGEPARLELHFTNSESARTRPIRVSGRFGTAGNGSVAVAGLRTRSATSITIDLPTPHRGVVQFGPLELDASDPLQVWKRTSSRSLDTMLIVRPRVHPLPGLFDGGGVRVGAGRPTAALRGGPDAEVDLVGLRPYVPGDDVRRIHWRTSARRNEPHVVQVEPPVGPASVVVVVDARSGFCDPERFELVVETAASICAAANAAGRLVRIVTTAGADTRFSATPTGLSDALDALARIRQGHTPALGSVLAGLDAPDTHVVICTGNPSVAGDTAITTGSLVVCWDGSTPLHDAIVAPVMSRSDGRGNLA